MKEKTVGQYTRKEFEELPERSWNEDIGEFDSLVILPMRHRHSSGYRNMDFVAVKDDKPTHRLSGCSDVIHFNGIGGFGLNWASKYGKVPEMVEPTGWNIDCLPVSGLLRIFCHDKGLIAGLALSSFELFSGEKIKRNENG